MDGKLLIEKNDFPGIGEMFGLIPGFCLMAGPCAVESREQMEAVAAAIAGNGIRFIRAGAFKPRSSPYDYQGIGPEGIGILREIGEKYSLLTVSEVLDPRDVEMCARHIDVLQVGSRSMSNTPLLKELGRAGRPVLLKRGMMATVREFMLAAEYVVSCGNSRLIMCERGIRTFETGTRNTLDISCAAIIKKETSLPVIVDLSHSLGRKDILLPVARAVAALGADGIMVEVHDNPPGALSDSGQQLSPEELRELRLGLEEFL